jgi:hypothetical protein
MKIERGAVVCVDAEIGGDVTIGSGLRVRRLYSVTFTRG